ncbi:MAG: Gfo/Idh/MocA family oxidoreductase [Eubacteriales bacterium]|nr:Gfo/Idh/MocA family oxidoreductase [Clostridiales bacterium]MDY2770654.1 Gfo/Idh/MocA family oxidoreductase [Eubacteriales bacterium]
MKLGEKGKTVRLGVIGLGGRGMSQTDTLLQMPDVEIVAVCDVYDDRVQKGQDLVFEKRGVRPDGETDYKKVLARPDIDAICVFTSWETHIDICVQAMRAGKKVATEVGGANSVDECWKLVRAKEETGIECMMLENCCYGKEEMTLLNMIRQGVFGTLVHCQGGYEHDLRDEIGNGDINRHYRQRHFLHRNGELYPTHELGPIAEYLNINRGNRMVSLCAMSSKAAGLHAWLQEHRPDSELVNAQVNQGDIVTTMISCANGETILLTHDCTLPRPYSRGGRIQGTKGIWMEDNRSIYIDGRSPVDPGYWTHRWEKDEAYMEEYKHPLWQAYEEFGLRGGHGGMDYLVLRAFVESVQKDECPPIDTYDTASWMAITALTEQSIAMGGAPVPVPDFTEGRWLQKRESFATGEYALN